MIQFLWTQIPKNKEIYFQIRVNPLVKVTSGDHLEIIWRSESKKLLHLKNGIWTLLDLDPNILESFGHWIRDQRHNHMINCPRSTSCFVAKIPADRLKSQIWPSNYLHVTFTNGSKHIRTLSVSLFRNPGKNKLYHLKNEIWPSYELGPDVLGSYQY